MFAMKVINLSQIARKEDKMKAFGEAEILQRF